MSIKMVDVENDVILVEVRFQREVYLKLCSIAETLAKDFEDNTKFTNDRGVREARLTSDVVKASPVHQIFQRKFGYDAWNEFYQPGFFFMLLNCMLDDDLTATDFSKLKINSVSTASDSLRSAVHEMAEL